MFGLEGFDYLSYWWFFWLAVIIANNALFLTLAVWIGKKLNMDSGGNPGHDRPVPFLIAPPEKQRLLDR